MDWPELSPKMTPVDDKEKSAELLTAQTETRLNNTEDDIRLKPLQPVISYSLPESTDSPSKNSNCMEDGDDMAVNLDDIGGAVSVGDEIMCSVDQYEIKNDLNLLAEQIPNAIDDVLKIVSEESVSDEGFEKDLTGPVEENKELKSICEIITPNSTLTSLVLPDDSVANEKLDLLNSRPSDHMLLSGLDKHIGYRGSIDGVEKLEVCESQPDGCNDISSNCVRNHHENIIIQDSNLPEGSSCDNVSCNEADYTLDTVSSRNENDCIADECDISATNDCLSAISSCTEKSENSEDIISKNVCDQLEIDESNKPNDVTEALKDCHFSRNLIDVDCNKNENFQEVEEIVNRDFLTVDYPSNSVENMVTESKEIIESCSTMDINEELNDDLKCSVNDSGLEQSNCFDNDSSGRSLSTISDKVETTDVLSSSEKAREDITPLCKTLTTGDDESLSKENDMHKVLKVSDLSFSSDLVKEKPDIILDNVESLINTSSERVECFKDSEKLLKSDECSSKSVDKIDELNTSEVVEDFDSSQQELMSLSSENIEDACASVASIDTSIELLSDDLCNSTSTKENFNSSILSEDILESVNVDNGCKKGISEDDECIEVLSEGNGSSVDKKEDSEEDCVLVECVEQGDISPIKLCDSGISSSSKPDSISTEDDKLRRYLDPQTSSVDNKILSNVSPLCEEPVPKSPSVSCVQSENTVVSCVDSNEKIIDNKKTLLIVPSSKENSNIEPSVQNDKTSLPIPLNIPIPSQKMPLMLPINLENFNISCVRSEKTILSVPERNSDCKSQSESVPPSLPVKGENNKQISEAVKFFFQQGSSRLDKFLGDKHPSSPIQNNPAKITVRKSSTDSEPIVSNQNKTIPDSQQRPRSCETAESASIPIAFFPESFIDSSGRKLPPLLPKIPMAFLISDIRSLPPGSVPSSEHKPDGVSVAGVSSTVSTVTGSSSVSSVGVNTNFGAENTIMPPQLHRIPKVQQKPKKCNRVKHIPQVPRGNQLPLSFINALNAMSSTGAGFIAANLSNGQIGDIKSVEQLLMKSSNEQRPRTKTKGPPRNKVARQPSRVVESTPSSQNNIVTTFRIPSALTIIPQTVKNSQSKSTETPVPKIPDVINDSVEDSVISRLKKLGTVIEVEREPPPQCVTPLILPPPPPLTPICMTRALPQNVNHSGFSNSGGPDITAQCLRMLESLAKTDNNATTNIPKKKPQQRKRQNSVSNKQISVVNSIKSNQTPCMNLVPIKSKETLKSDTINSGKLVHNSSEISSVSSVNMPLSVQSSSSQTNSAPVSSAPTIEHIMPSSSSLSADDAVKPVPSCGIFESSVSSIEPEPSLKQPKPAIPKPAQEPEQVEPKFVFQIDSSQVLSLPNGQRMLTCEVCDGVYHKTMSLKRHYLRTHINKKYISESDQIMCGMIRIDAEKPQPPKKITKVFIGDLSNWINTSMPGLFKCFTCGACFDQKSELRTHLMEHPPVSLLKVKDGSLETFMCSGCSKTFPRKKLFVQHRRICDQKNETPLLNQHCLYCDKSFLSIANRNKHHFKLHHPKRKYQPCFICKSEKNKDTSTLFRHLCMQHKDKYFGCIQCKLRFLTRTELIAHNKEEHSSKKFDKKQKKSDGEEKKLSVEDSGENNNKKVSVSVKDSLGKHKCSVCSKPFSSELNVSRHYRLAHGVHPRRKVQPPQVTTVKEEEKPKVEENKETCESIETKNKSVPPSSPVVMDPETLFYSRISINIRENLLHHLDGKLDSQEVLEFDLNSPADQASKNKLMNFSASFTSSRGSTETDSSVSDSRHASNPVSPKVPWEKFNFPKNYDGRCGLTSYIKDMSHLDISTQLTMRRNLQRLNSTVEVDPSPDILADIPAGLSLIGSSSETFGDNEKLTPKEENKGTELSGEWTRPRSYVCAVCNLNTSNLWELEDHKLALHPNVWCPHHEVLAEHTSSWELVYNRVTPAPSGILHPSSPVELPLMNTTNRCTKCTKYYPNSSDLHRHMLDCGGDTTWMSTMLAVSSPGGTRRNRKWRPFGSRRRRQQGRRGLKRNIPNTPAKQPGMRVRTKPGDMESIQKMLANLPPKRVTRRIIGEDGEIKTRSQGTLSSASVGVSVMQRSRTSLTKFVKKFDGSKSVAKNVGSIAGKGVKDLKPTVEERKDKYKKLNRPVKRILADSPVKKIQETSNEIKTEGIELKDVKKEKTDDSNGGKSEALCQSDCQITESSIANDKKSEVLPKAEYKEINIVVVSSGKREAPDSGVEPSNGVVQAIKKKKTHESEGSFVDKTDNKVDFKEKLFKTTARCKPKEEKGINTELVNAENTAGSVAPVGPQLIKCEMENNDSKSTNSPKKQLKEKKEESDKKKLVEIGEKKKIEDAKNKANMEENLIICNGCGIQFDSASACQRHMKKCVFRKEEKAADDDHGDDIQGSHTCGLCNQSFPYLMALLRHKCDSPSEDRVMPELIREEPFEAAPLENTKDIPVLSPEDIRKSITEKSSSGTSSPTKQSLEKKSGNKSVYKRTSTVESIADTIREVAQETFSIDHFIWVNGTISHKKESVIKLMDSDIVSPSVIPPCIVNECQEPSNEEPKFSTENRDNCPKKATEDIVIVNSTIKTVPKLVKLKSPITARKTFKEAGKTSLKKSSSTSALQKSPRVIKMKQITIKQKRRNKNRKIVLNRPVVRKKRSTALEILLRENKLMAESRKPVKTVEKRRSNSPIRSIARRFRKRRKLSPDENFKTVNNDWSGESFESILIERGEKLEVIPENENDLSDCIERLETENEDLVSRTENKPSLLPLDVSAKENDDESIESNKELNSAKHQFIDEEEIEGIIEENSNEQNKNSPKVRSRSPSKKLKLNESLIITGSRRKTSAINRWDMYRPSCSNGKVYCEPCNKEVKEDSMAKHEQSSSHSKNFDLKNDFDNLFPDAYKFVTKCNECSWNFPTPFTCYKHYLQKHESSLLLLLDQVMAEKKGVFEPSAKKSDTPGSSKGDYVDENYRPIDLAENDHCDIKNEENDFKQTSEEEEPGSLKHLESTKGIEDIHSFKQTETLEDLESTDQLVSEELRLVNSHRNKSDILRNKTESPGAKLIYCNVCNKGIKLETMDKHEQGCTHKKNYNLKKEFDNKFSEEKQKLFPVYCEKCNWHFTSPFLCYKHYLSKHVNEVANLFGPLELSNDSDFKSCSPGQGNSEETDLWSESNNSERLSSDIPYSENSTSPSHLFCKVCDKKVKFGLISKHVNTSFHKQNLGTGLESVTFPAECKRCQRVADCPFLCYNHYKNISESVMMEKKKQKKKKACVKREKESVGADNDRLLNTVRHGKVVKKRKKLKLKRIHEKLQSFLKEDTGTKSEDKSANRDKAVEIRTDISADISSDRLLKRRKKRFRFSQIRNCWKVSVVDPGLVTTSDPSCHNVNVKVEIKTENPDTLKSSFLDVPKIIPKESLLEDVKPILAAPSAAAATERRSSSVGGSEFYCLLCQKQFSSAVLLVRHQNSPVHKYNESRNKQPPRNVKLRISSDSSNGSSLSKRSESPVPIAKREPPTSLAAKLKESNTAAGLPVTPTPPISQFQGSEGSETSQEWNDNRFINLEHRDNVIDQSAVNTNQDWTHEWVMSGSNSVVPPWDLSSSIGQSQLWDNNDNNFMNAAGCSSSLGSILDSVNKILADECGDASLLPHYSLSELQSAMGASDEEMAMLQQLGERSLQDDFIYDGSGSVCSQNEQWSVSGSTSAPGSNIDDNTTTLMDLDNQQPPPPPSTTSVSQQESAASNVSANTSGNAAVSTSNNTSGPTSSVKSEPVDICDNLVDKTSCRGLNGRPRRLLSDYESREMVCPSCSKHFLGLSALQTHLSWSKCSQNTNNNSNSNTRTNIWLRRKAIFNRPEDVDRRLVCFICKEIFNCPTTLNKHVASNHMKKDTRAQLSVNQNSDGSDGAEKLKSKMSNALGGLLDRALNNLLCSKAPSLGLSGQDSSGPELSSGTIQLLGKLCATRLKSEVSGNLAHGPTQCRQPSDKKSTSKSFNSTIASEFKQIISRGGKPKTDNTNSCNNIVSLDHVVLANGQEQPTYACPICDDRFFARSTRNRHLSRAHGRYGRNQLNQMTEEPEPPEQDNPIDTNVDNEFDQDWRDAASPSCDSDAEDAEKDTKVKPLCSDCGLSFPTFQEVIRHRKELHSTHVVKEESDLPVSENIVDSTSGEGKRRGKRSPKSTVSKGSTEQVGSTKQITRSRRRLRNTTLLKSEKDVTSESEQNVEDADKDLCSDSNEKTEEINKKEDEPSKNSNKRKLSTASKRRKSLEAGVDDDEEDDSEDLVVKKKSDKRKIRLAHLAQEDVRVKAEAALRELNLPKRNRIQPSPSRWGIETIRFTKQNSAEMIKSSTAAYARTNSASTRENKWKVPSISTSQSEANIKAEPQCQSTNESSKFTDIYDFNDEELYPKKMTLHYGQQRDDKEDDNVKSSHCKEDIKSSVDS